jgi:hypothetical protein
MGPRTIFLALVHSLTAGCLAVVAQQVILLWHGWTPDLVAPTPPFAYPGLPVVAMLAGALLGPVLHVTLRSVLAGTKHGYIFPALFGMAYSIALMAVTIVGWYLYNEVAGRPAEVSVAGALGRASLALVFWLPMFVGAGLLLVGPMLLIAGATIGLVAAAAEKRNTR